ncbi:MAG: 23S rRNA (guanosine(2251)-2'-O)-methyltransferase RlmB [Actinomycetota bacterium]|nr:23S rRNA (guanosine(2251)-2'-O)-methyltransferase RlmB [Actinomycetota bacterium]
MKDQSEFIYGRRAVAEAQRGRRGVRRVLTSDEHGAEELARLAGSLDHQGVVAEVDPYPYADAESLLAQPEPLIVALDQIQDPQNLGAVCRSAEAAGATGVIIPDRRAASVTPAVCKASAGAVEHLPIARVGNLADWLEAAKGTDGLWVYGADGGAPAVYTSVEMTGPVILVLGGEGRGIRPRVASACDALVSIPLQGATASLNVSAAAAVLLFEAVRQRDA